MIKPLRTYHFYLWRIFAFTLPTIFVLSIALRPNAKPTVALAGLRIHSTITSDSTAAVTIEVTSMLQSASCVVYSEDKTGRELLGSLKGIGSYTFHSTSFNKIILYDKIKERKLLEWTPEQ